MTDSHAADSHAADAPDHAAAADDDLHESTHHGDALGHEEHAPAGADLGPIDVTAWGAGVLGIAIAVVIAACFVLATSGLG